MLLKLSFQTWYIHSLSVIDWLIFIEIFWQYAYQIKSKTLIRFIPSLTLFFLSAICILSWHYFLNLETLNWLIGLQSMLTFIGNFSLIFSNILLVAGIDRKR